jgi:putative membrane protein
VADGGAADIHCRACADRKLHAFSADALALHLHFRACRYFAGRRRDTYARVPFGFQIAEALGLHRNPYDKIGHFAQGFVPALAAREILLRGGYVRAGKMLSFLVTCVVLAISASYELIEWGAAVAMGQGADEFLGTQGDPWDTQSDMLFALIGAVVAQAVLARTQDRQIVRLRNSAFSSEVNNG